MEHTVQALSPVQMHWECAFFCKPICEITILIGGPRKFLEKSLKNSCNFLYEPWTHSSHQHLFKHVFGLFKGMKSTWLQWLLESGCFINRTWKPAGRKASLLTKLAMNGAKKYLENPSINLQLPLNAGGFGFDKNEP